MDIINTKFLNVSRPYISSQSQNSLIQLQIAYTLFHVRFFTKGRSQALIELHLFAPRQTRDTWGHTLGYKCKGFRIRIGNFALGSN